jgi:ATP-dependent DNA ligase
MTLPLRADYAPMEARLVDEIPIGPTWQYEPKWDGFRCLAFRDGESVVLRSKSGKPLERYFPDVVAAVRAVPASRFVLDGELVVPVGGHLAFDELLQRIHPAASRVRRLAAERPAMYIVFDLLVDDEGRSLIAQPLAERRRRLEAFARKHLAREGSIRLSPATDDLEAARAWLSRAGGNLDGIVAKVRGVPYLSGRATAWSRSSAGAPPTAWWAASATPPRPRWWARCCSASTTTPACSTTWASPRASPRPSGRPCSRASAR